MARAFSTQQAKAIIEQAHQLIRDLDGAASSLPERSSALKSAIVDARNRCRDRILSRVPVLEQHDPERCLVPEDPSSTGSTTLSALAQDPENANRVVWDTEYESHTVCDCAKRAYDGSRIWLDADDHDYVATQVVRAAYARAQIEPLAGRATQLLVETRHQVESLVQRIQIGTGSLKWLFSSRDDKDAAERAYAELSELLSGALGVGARSVVRELDSVDHVADSEVWIWFRNNENAVFALIESTEPGSVGLSDWPFDSVDARHLADQTKALSEGMNDAENIESELKQRVKNSVAHCMSSEMMRALRNIDVDELNRNRKGIRVGALRDAGFESVADVYSANLYEIDGVRGISEEGAAEIKREANTIVREVESGIKLRLSVDKKTEEATSVVNAVHAYMGFSALRQEHSRLSDIVSSQVQKADRGLRAARRPLHWLFTSKDIISTTDQSYRDLSAFLGGSDAEQARSLLSIFASLRTGEVDSKEAWNAFAAHPVAFFNVIEDIVPNVLGNDDHQFGLPEDLAREIQDECFFPDGLRCTLRRYQEWGVKYILHQEKTLLGDEMGLGKTVQAIASMVSLRNTGETHFLVVCPASVLENWCREISKHSLLGVTKVHGATAKRALKAWEKSGGAAVTTYETTGKLLLPEEFRIGLLVVDEAHYIKNPDAQRSENTLALLSHANRAVLMTGTALENKVDEMLTLIGYLRPDIAARAKSLAFMAGAPRFRDEVAPVYYRRKREDVLTELPDLIEKEEWGSMDEKEQEAYEWGVLTGGRMGARRVSWNVQDLKHSSKACRLREILEEAEDAERKTLIFTFFLRTAEVVSKMLGDKCIGIINGSVPPSRRQAIVEQFEEAPAGSVLVSQIDAGGTGMNIQAASVVVLCEPQYKPSTENQAISRAYRMGQVRNVLVYRLLCENSIDEIIMDRLKMKQAQFDAFADRSSAAEASQLEDVGLDEQSMDRIIEEEIERIKRENPELAEKARRFKAQAGTVGPADGASARDIKATEPLPKAVRRPERNKSRSRSEKSEPEPRRQRFCVKCGGEYPEGASFCPFCGTRIEALTRR